MRRAFIFFVVLLLSILTFIFPEKIYAQEKAAGNSAILASGQKEAGEDYRAKVLKNFLKLYNSPLSSSSEAFVKAADTYELDWKLLVAISGVESTFGQQILYGSYNAWGWGIYGNNAIYFESWNQAIETISKGLRVDYINRWGAEDMYQIGRFYAASPTWAYRVAYFMQKIDQFAANDPESALPISL